MNALKARSLFVTNITSDSSTATCYMKKVESILSAFGVEFYDQKWLIHTLAIFTICYLETTGPISIMPAAFLILKKLNPLSCCLSYLIRNLHNSSF